MAVNREAIRKALHENILRSKRSVAEMMRERAIAEQKYWEKTLRDLRDGSDLPNPKDNEKGE